MSHPFSFYRVDYTLTCSCTDNTLTHKSNCIHDPALHIACTCTHLGLTPCEDLHVVSYVSLVEDDLGGQEELVLLHQRQPHELLGGISEEGGLREGGREGGRQRKEGGEYGGQT